MNKPGKVDELLAEMRRGSALVWYGGNAFVLSLDGSCRLINNVTARAATKRDGVYQFTGYTSTYVMRIED